MQPEEGKFYKTRDGRKVGPVVVANGNDPDLIAEWTDEPETLTVSRVEFNGGIGNARVYLSNGAELCGVIHAEAEVSAGDITRAALVVKVG